MLVETMEVIPRKAEIDKIISAQLNYCMQTGGMYKALINNNKRVI